jgi:hypothetical protein
MMTFTTSQPAFLSGSKEKATGKALNGDKEELKFQQNWP